MSTNYKDRKVNKKQRRCEAIIEKDCNVRRSDTPTCFLSILNAGLATGLTEDLVLNTTSKYGNLNVILMLQGKSFCFLECPTITDAENIYCGVHNNAKIGQNGAIVFLSYFEKLPQSEVNSWQKLPPGGLILMPDFITVKEESSILNAVCLNGELNTESQPSGGTLKHRQVLHFGYEFLYGINNVDPNKPLKKQIPTECDVLWPRIKCELEKRGYNKFDWPEPDQLTVNFYEPGQGIPSHVDTHSAFLDPILSLSLLGDTVMDFRRGTDRIPILIPSRSMLVMSGAARYDWTHGITPRFQDVVPSASGALTTCIRTKRISLTFRRLRRGPCDCNYPALCDTRLQQKIDAVRPKLEEIAQNLEELNVHQVYDEIATHFSETRHSPWPKVEQFLKTFPPGSVLVDIGSGNGKYLQCQLDCLTIGCDRSQGLLEICAAHNNNIFRCDCLCVPLRSNSIDGCISIAVIHHLATVERRLQALREMVRILRKGGKALIYVWAKDQSKEATKSSYLRQNKAVNKHKATEDEQRQQTLQENYNVSSTVSLPVHTNRTDFEHQDVLVPWKLKNGSNTSKSKFLRYYHVFEEKELEAILKNLSDIKLIDSYYDQGNHCVIFERL